MELSQTFDFIRNIHCQLDYGPIDNNVNRKSAVLWKSCDYNILTFLDKLDSESKAKFLKWLERYGLTDINDLRKAYITLSLVLKKIKENSPSEIRQYWNDNKTRNIVGFVCYYSSAEKVIEWAKTVITQEELERSKEISLTDSPTVQLPPQRPQRAPTKPPPGHTATRISQPSSSHPSQMFGMLVNKNQENSNQLMKGVRSLQELKAAFGEK